MTTIALFGAAGKIGMRITDKLKDDPAYHTLYVEAGEAGEARLRKRGLAATAQEEAVRRADVVILAVPDVVLGSVAAEIVPTIKSGAMVICLDPAAPLAGVARPLSAARKSTISSLLRSLLATTYTTASAIPTRPN